MTYQQAWKLHNGDEVAIKETGEIVKVVQTRRIGLSSRRGRISVIVPSRLC